MYKVSIQSVRSSRKTENGSVVNTTTFFLQGNEDFARLSRGEREKQAYELCVGGRRLAGDRFRLKSLVNGMYLATWSRYDVSWLLETRFAGA